MDTVMNKIDVQVQPAYIAEQSDPDNNHYVFSYTVTIRNNGSMPAKLLTRHWIITDGDGMVQEVKVTASSVSSHICNRVKVFSTPRVLL